MYTPTNAYSRKISSGLILTVLALSAFAALFAIAPAVPSAKAANAQFGASFTYPYAYVTATTGTAIVRAISISDPAGNAGITEVDVSIPLLAATTVPAPSATTSTCYSGFINDCAASVSGSGPWTVVYSSSTAAGDTILAQGSAGYLALGFSTETAESTAGVVDVYSITVRVTYSDGTTQTSTLSFREGSANTVTLTATVPATLTAGTSVPVSASATCANTATYTCTIANGGTDQGVPLTFSYAVPTSAATPNDVVPSTFTATFSPVGGSTSSSGTASSTFTSTYADTNYVVTADAGTFTAADGDSGGNLHVVGSSAFTYVPAAPTEVTVTIPPWSATAASPYTSLTPPYYVSSTATKQLYISLADKYGNPVAPGGPADSTFTATALKGTISYTTGNTYGEIATTGGDVAGFLAYYTACTVATCTAGSTDVLPYGSYDLVSVSLTVPAATVVTPSPYAGTYSGTSSGLVIGYEGLAVGGITPAVNVYTVSTMTPCSANCPTPATKVELSATVDQADVPVNFTLTAGTNPITGTTAYTGTFSNGLSWIVVDSNSNGIASANFTSDSTLGDEATAAATIPTPTTASPTLTLTTASTAPIETGYGTAAELVISTYFAYAPVTKALSEPSSYVGPLNSLYVDVSLADAYGNTVANPSVSAYGITISVTAGSLTSTFAYISPTDSDTTSSGFVISLVAPATTGTITLAASTTAYGIKGTSVPIYVVSVDPEVSLTPPVTTSFASTTTYTATINATAIPSPSATPGTAVVSFAYSLNGAAQVTAPLTGSNSSGAAFTSFTVTLNQGSNTIEIYATDSASNTGSGTFTFTVSKVITTAITFTTPGAAPEVSAGYTGDEVNFTNTGVAQTVNVYIVWYNSANQVVSTSAQLNVSFTHGQTQEFFNAYSVSGTYTVQAFVRSTTNFPASTSYAATVTIP